MPKEMGGCDFDVAAVAASAEESLEKGLAFLRDKANQYRIFE